MPTRISGVLLCALLTVLPACDELGGEGNGVPNPTLPPTEEADLQAVLAAAAGTETQRGLLGVFWAGALGALDATASYREPARIIAHETGELPNSACVDDPEDVALNATYCFDDEVITLDLGLMRTLYARVGRVAPLVWLAHEWGHHVQNLTGLSTHSVQNELQADCYAGLFIGWLMDNEQVGEDDLRVSGANMYIMGDRDYRASDWFEPGVHGPASWRAKAFVDGAFGEPAYCTDYSAWTERGTEALGQYRWLPSPGLSIAERRSNGVLVVTGHGYTAYLAHLPNTDGQAIDQLPAVIPGWFGDLDVSPVEGPVEIPVRGSLGGSAAFQAYEITSATGTEHGVLLLHVATSGGAAVVSAVAPGPSPGSPTGSDTWDELATFLYVTAYGLCPPDGGSPYCAALGS